MCHMLGSITWTGVSHFLSALMTPLIAAIAVSIAWQQYVVRFRTAAHFPMEIGHRRDDF